MMTLKDVKAWIKPLVPECKTWKVGVYDNTKDKTICVRNLASDRSSIAIGGLRQTSAAVKGISIVVHWNKNPDETEQVSQKVHALFYGQNPSIGKYQVAKCDMRNDEPVSVGIDENGIYEYVIELWITYKRDGKEF